MTCLHCGQPIKLNEIHPAALGRWVHCDGLFSCFGENYEALGTTATPNPVTVIKQEASK